MGDPKEHFSLDPIGGVPDTPTGADGRPVPPGSPKEAAAPPLSPPPAASPSEAPSLLELAEDHCPKCGMVLSHDAVFCIKCGYDLRTNEVRQATVGVEHVAEAPAAPLENVFSPPGRGNVQVLAAIGGGLTLGAMIFAGLNALPPTAMAVFANVVLCLYETALHTGTGIVAVLIAARLADLKIGRLDLAAARIFVAFAAFQLIHSITFGEYQTLVRLAMYPVALAVYWVLVMFLFRKPRMVAVTVMVAHFVLWFAVELGMGLSAYVSRVAQETVVVEKPVPAAAE